VAARFAFYLWALAITPLLIWVWFFGTDDPPAGQVWLAWFLLLLGPAWLTALAGIATRRGTIEFIWTAIGSTAVTLFPILLFISALMDTVS
jgi:hypothetical protein